MLVKSIVTAPKRSKQKFGTLQKCEIHLHTPASHDYELSKGSKYCDLTIEDILRLCIREGFLNIEQTQNFSEQIKSDKYEGIDYQNLLREKELPFESLKEYLAYMLIAHKLYSEDIQVVVITDHNTVSGFNKLKHALDYYFKTRIKIQEDSRKSIFLMLGIEVTCSDKNHVVGIFREEDLPVVEEFISNHIYSAEDGTIENSLTIINKIYELGGLGYLAHMNSSDFLGTGLYKKELFTKTRSNFIGSTNLDAMKRIFDTKILPHTNKKMEDFCVIHEGDSHFIEGIGKRNTWIKLNELSFNAFKKSLFDYQLSVYTEKPQITDKFIKSIHIRSADEGFLSGKNKNQSFFVEFSRDLNCIIGGRGTGKSTLLNIIDTIFSRTSPNKEQLKFLSEHRVIEVVFTYNGCDYKVRFISQLDPGKEYYNSDFFLEKAFKEGKYNYSERLILTDHWIDLYKLNDDNEEPVTGHLKEEILDKVYRQSYSINNIIQKIDKGEVGDFVKEVIFDGIQTVEIETFLKELKTTHQNSIRKYFKENLPFIKLVLAKRDEIISEKISSFNKENEKLLKITYGTGRKSKYDYIEELLFGINRNRNIKNSLLKWEDVERYLYQITKKMDFLEFLDLLLWQKFRQLEKVLSLSAFAKRAANKSLSDINAGYEPITEDNRASIYREIIKVIFKNRDNLDACLRKFFAAKDDFDIDFNINSKESTVSNGVLFKPIELLSLGQKVVAILTFIFKFGLHTNDNTPLIIDQPEDNLDSQYIYKNLVDSLKQIKNKRQVIVVTHNPSIVTNAAAEQVIVLASENGKGWVEDQGYHGNAKITKHILQYLEGGEESFLHKMETYKTILEIGK